MKKKVIYLTGVLLFTFGLLIFLAVDSNKETEFDEIEFNNSTSNQVKTTSSGTRYTVHPENVVAGCPGKDCIPSIDDPKFVEADEADWLEPDERVIGVEIENESKAYPLRILSAHEIVNDKIGGEPVIVTYCPLCRSGLTYSREVNGKVLEFGVSGKLRNANLVMYDRQTETYWSQIKGKAIVGPMVPEKLNLKFSSITEWEEWKEAYPDTKVLSRETGIYPPNRYDNRLYQGYKDSERVGFGVNNVDDRLKSKKIVYGINLGNKSIAYTEEAVRNEKLIKDKIGNESIVIFENPEDGSIRAFKLNKKADFSIDRNSLQDAEGNKWSFEGKEIDGEGKLEGLNPKGFYWFAWTKFNPETQLYKQDEKK